MPNELDQPLSEAELAQQFMEEGRQPPEVPPVEKTLDEVLDPEPEPEVVEDAHETAHESAQEVAQEVAEPTDLPEELPDPDLEPESFEQPEHLAWAERRNLTNFEDAAKLAFEQERFLGRRASEIQELREQLEQVEVPVETQQRSDDWIAAAISSPDPGRYAMELAQAGEWQAYDTMMQAWESVVGETVVMNVHNQIQGAIQQQQAEQPQFQPVGPDRVREAFALAGIFDLDNHPLRPTIVSVADEMGGAHPLVQGAAQGDPMAVSAIVEIARARTVTTRTLRMDGTEVDDAGRQAAASLTGNGGTPSRTPPRPDPFEKLDEEWRRMGVLRDE